MNIRDYKLISPVATKTITADMFNRDDIWIESGIVDGRRTRSKDAEINKAAAYKDAIGVIYRCIDVRAAIISSLPWTLMRGKEVLVDSETIRDEGFEDYSWLDTLGQFLYLTESSLLLSSEAFWLKQKNYFGKNLGMRWLASPFVSPKYDERSGIVGFERRWGTINEFYGLDDVVYFWIQDPLAELIPDIPQVVAAAASANVILNYENFVSKFYERGAVKATILKVDRSTPPKERTRLREFWQSFMSGGNNAYATEVVSGDVEAEVIGEGAGDSEKTEVLTSRRKDIATAMGVPYSLLFGDTSSSYTAGPTEERNFLNYTVIPRAKLIQGFLNRQVFQDEGIYFRFNLSTLPAFREANKIVSDVFTAYTTALIPHSISAKLAGIVLPEGTSYEDLDRMVAEERERQFKEKERIVTLNSKINQDDGGGSAPKPKGEDNNLKSAEERRLRKWLKNRKNAAIEDFESEILTLDEMKVIFEETKGVATEQPPFGLSSAKALEVYGSEYSLEIDGLEDLEGEGAEKINELFSSQVAMLVKKIRRMNENEITSDIDRMLEEFNGDMRDYLVDLLLAYSLLGVEAGSKIIKSFYPHFDNSDAIYEAREFATKRALEVLAIITATTSKRVKQIVGEWRMTELPVEWLERELKKALDLDRAKLIASNESMVVINTALLITYRSARIIQMVRWTATLDERTCPVCGRLHGKTYFMGAVPKYPAHSRCRCFFRPVVDTKFLAQFFEMERARIGG